KVTMVGLDVTHRTNFGRAHLARLARTHGTENDFATRVMAFLIDLSAKFGGEGTPMHDPLAMGVAIDPSFVKTAHMRVDVESRGSVYDETKAALPGATVTLTNAATGFTRSVATNAAGAYSFAQLPTGTYGMRAELSGFAPTQVTGLVVNIGAALTYDLTMSLA